MGLSLLGWWGNLGGFLLELLGCCSLQLWRMSDFQESTVGMKPSYERLIGQMLVALEGVWGGSRLQNTLFSRWGTGFLLCGPCTIKVVLK